MCRTPLLHRLEVPDHQADVVQDRAERPSRSTRSCSAQPALELDMHHRLAVRRIATREHALQAPVLRARGADHRVQQQPRAQLAGAQLLVDGVHEERGVVGAALDDGPRHEVAVGLKRGNENADARGVVATPVDEGEGASNPPEQLLHAEALEIVVGQPPEEHLREDPDRILPVGGHRRRDLGKERLEDRGCFGLRGEGGLGGGGLRGGFGHVRAPRSVACGSVCRGTRTVHHRNG